MANLYNKFLDFIGIEESDEDEDDRRDEYYEDEEEDWEREERRDYRREPRGREPRDQRESGRRRDSVVEYDDMPDRRDRRDAPRRDRDRDRERDRAVGNPGQTTGGSLPISGGMKMVVYHPVSYEDAQAIIDNLRNRKPVIVNIEELDPATAQRILDFLSGAIYALSGTMCKVSRGIFVVAPNNYDVIGNGADDYIDLR